MPRMTIAEYSEKTLSLQKKAANLRAASKRAFTLAEKVRLQREAKAVEEELYRHKLDFYELTSE